MKKSLLCLAIIYAYLPMSFASSSSIVTTPPATGFKFVMPAGATNPALYPTTITKKKYCCSLYIDYTQMVSVAELQTNLISGAIPVSVTGFPASSSNTTAPAYAYANNGAVVPGYPTLTNSSIYSDIFRVSCPSNSVMVGRYNTPLTQSAFALTGYGKTAIFCAPIRQECRWTEDYSSFNPATVQTQYIPYSTVENGGPTGSFRQVNYAPFAKATGAPESDQYGAYSYCY